MFDLYFLSSHTDPPPSFRFQPTPVLFLEAKGPYAQSPFSQKRRRWRQRRPLHPAAHFVA
jgi:hypothetical protein